MNREPRRKEGRRGLGFWASAAVGWAVIGWGVRGALQHHQATRPPELIRYLVAGDVIHDLLFAPVVLLGGFLAGRLLPPRWRPYGLGGLMVSGALVLFSFAEVRGYARALHNPTSLPHNYAVNLAVVLTAVWAVTAALALLAHLRRRHRPQPHQ